MTPIGTRRQVLFGSLGALSFACASSPLVRSPAPRSEATGELSDIERKVGGRLGVFVLDTGTGKQFGHRADERFAMCSTFKWALAAAILARVDQGQLSLQERVAYGPSDILEYAPVTAEHVSEGAMTIDALARAAVTVSDNTAANLLLSRIGGPPALTQFCRLQGDLVTRLDRDEETLNTNLPGDPRDTTTPRAMADLMRRVLCGDALSHEGRERLLAWLRACETGKARLRAGLPGNWLVGDKTGTGARGAVNDVAIAVPPNRAPILIAAYLSDGNSDVRRLEAAHADVARLVVRELS